MYDVVLDTVLELLAVIVKWGDDLRQEVLCSQLLKEFKVIPDVQEVDLLSTYVYLLTTVDGVGS